jgi:hypothetical protein
MTGSRGAIPIQAPHLLKARSDRTQRLALGPAARPLDSYVNDVPDAPLQCVFYEDELTRE